MYFTQIFETDFFNKSTFSTVKQFFNVIKLISDIESKREDNLPEYDFEEEDEEIISSGLYQSILKLDYLK